MIHLTLNIAGFAIWLLQVIFWAVLSIGGWIALTVAIGTILVLVLRRWIRRPPK